MAVPNLLNYADTPAALKNDVISTPIVVNIIIFDCTTSGRRFIDTKSIYFSCKAVATNGTIGAGKILATLVYLTFFELIQLLIHKL